LVPVVRQMLKIAGVVSMAATFGCPGSHPCPEGHEVVLDAPATGFSRTGEWRSDAVCERYCAGNEFVCQLEKSNVVRCQIPCE
jgi:hypothetical protein